MCEEEIKIFPSKLLMDDKNNGLEILKKFKKEEEIKEIKNKRGVYAIYLKDDKKKDFLGLVKENIITKEQTEDGEKCRQYIEKRLSEINNLMQENGNYKNLFYIGQTKRNFNQRVIGNSGHIRGGCTSLNIMLLRILTGKKSYDSKNGNEFRDSKKDLLGDSEWEDFFWVKKF